MLWTFIYVSDQGFIDLLAVCFRAKILGFEYYFTNTMLSTDLKTLKIEIRTQLSQAPFLSFTSYIRIDFKTNESYLSLTAHW